MRWIFSRDNFSGSIFVEAERFFDARALALVVLGTDRVTWFPTEEIKEEFTIRWIGSAASNTLQRIITFEGKPWPPKPVPPRKRRPRTG